MTLLATEQKMIKEIITSLRSTVTERLASPLFGSFITAWLLLNWRIVYTFLRPLDTAEATIAMIDTYIGPWLTVVIPLAVSLFYVALFPWIRLGLWMLQSGPVRKQRLAEYDWEKPILRARREVLMLEHELSLIRVEKEAEIEQKKLRLEAELEDKRITSQQLLEQKKMQAENDLRLRELRIKERELKGS